jgi:hypothetical protein
MVRRCSHRKSSRAIRCERLCHPAIDWYAPLMPTVLRQGPYRFFFYASDRPEPLHVHVSRESAVAKFWLEPVRLARSGGFARQELLDIHGL